MVKLIITSPLEKKCIWNYVDNGRDLGYNLFFLATESKAEVYAKYQNEVKLNSKRATITIMKDKDVMKSVINKTPHRHISLLMCLSVIGFLYCHH